MAGEVTSTPSARGQATQVEVPEYCPAREAEWTVDTEADQIVVRTSNKKYFKRIDVDDMDRARIPLEEGPLSWSHDNSTLIIQYKKPAAVLNAEKDAKVSRLSAPEQPPQQDEQCKQQ